MSQANLAARSLNADPPRLGFTYGTTVGTNPLDTNDGDTSYAQVAAGEAVTFRLQWHSGDAMPAAGMPGMYLTFDVGFRSLTDGSGSLEVVARPLDSSWVPVYVYPSPTSYELHPDLGWDDGKIRWDGSYFLETSTVEDLLSGNVFWILETSPAGHAIRVTYLRARLIWPGSRPLRWRQRNDGLGGGSPTAARGVNTQQGSLRHRGIL